MTAPEGRSLHWHEGVYPDGYYDLWLKERFIGWTNNAVAAVTWVVRGEVSPAIVFIYEGMRVEDAADIIMNHQLDGAGV